MDSSVGYESLCLGVRHMFFYEKCGDLCSIRQDVGARTFIVYSTRAVQALTVFRSVENSVSGRACPPFDVYLSRFDSTLALDNTDLRTKASSISCEGNRAKVIIMHVCEYRVHHPYAFNTPQSKWETNVPLPKTTPAPPTKLIRHSLARVNPRSNGLSGQKEENYDVLPQPTNKGPIGVYSRTQQCCIVGAGPLHW